MELEERRTDGYDHPSGVCMVYCGACGHIIACVARTRTNDE